MIVILSSGMPEAAKARNKPTVMMNILINKSQLPRPTLFVLHFFDGTQAGSAKNEMIFDNNTEQARMRKKTNNPLMEKV
jgi:hypothetical protein